MRELKGVSWLNFILGIWLIISPFVLLYRGLSQALWDNVIVGIIIAILAIWRALAEETEGMTVISWVLALLGLWTLISPFVLGYAQARNAMVNNVIVGIVVGILAIWRGSVTSAAQPLHQR
ncbi:MAG TPA: SPW repeat protein [Candidatus Binatia bacterium]|jgi:hypothetical protein